MTLRYGSICSGIEAATVAWHQLGWTPAFFAEIEKFPSEVLAHHYGSNLPGKPWAQNGVPNYGDITRFEEWPDADIDVLVGGTPCQDYSVAGRRLGMAGDRGQLTLTFIEIAARYRPRRIVWENVPGVLSSNGGRDFARFLGDLSGTVVEVPKGGWQTGGIVPGIADAYGLAYRVLDAQYVRVDGYGRAVPQRRRRVFVVGYLGDWRCAAAVLLEPESVSGNPAPRRSSGESPAGTLAGGARQRGGYSHDDVPLIQIPVGDLDGASKSLNATSTASGYMDVSVETFIATQEVAPAITSNSYGDNVSREGLLVAFDTTQITHPENRCNPKPGDPCHPLAAGSHVPAIAFDCKAGADTGFAIGEVPGPLRGEGHGGGHAAIATRWSVRRLTPTECERLQGFPDGYTRLPGKRGSWRPIDETETLEELDALGYATRVSKKGVAQVSDPDGPRYKALGNSMACNAMRWIGRRIEMVEAMESASAREAAE